MLDKSGKNSFFNIYWRNEIFFAIERGQILMIFEGKTMKVIVFIMDLSSF